MKIIDDNLINGVAEQAKQSPIAARMVLTFLKTYGMVWNSGTKRSAGMQGRSVY